MKKRKFAILKVLIVLIATLGTLIVLESLGKLLTDIYAALVVLKYIGALAMAIIPLLLHQWFTRQEKWPLGLAGARIGQRFVTGSLSGILLMLFSIILVFAFGGATFGGVKSEVSFGSLLFLISSSLFVSFGEETLFRGSIQGLLKHDYGRWIGLFGSSALFFLSHGANPAMFESYLPPLNLFLSGFVLGLLREKTGSLWVPIGFHWTWNTVQELAGFATSGFVSKDSILNLSQVPGKEMISGGNFGIEGSLISFALLLFLAFFLLKGLKIARPSESIHQNE